MTDPDRLRLRARVKAAEGFRGQPYRDSLGYLTIGFGRLIDPTRGGGISQDEADYLLRNDLRVAERLCEGMDGYLELSPARQAVLIEMAFNMGAATLRTFTRMFRALQEQDYAEAAEQLLDSRWHLQVGHRAEQLAVQMRTGQWPTS